MITTINEFSKSRTPMKKYLGQCDMLRRGNPENEKRWQDMMNNKVRITFIRFIQQTDYKRLLDNDNDETIQEFISNAKRTDSTTAAYSSNWGDKDAVFLQTAGFEFIFV